MKNKMLKILSIIIPIFVVAFSVVLPVSAVHMVSQLSDEDFAKAEGFIEADDRVGLYDFLYEIHTEPDGVVHDFYFISFTTGFTDSYKLDDDSYNTVLKHYVLPFDADAEREDPIAVPTPIIGDVNMDGKVSIFDIIMVNKISVGIITVQNIDQALAADVDGSYVIDANDVNLIVQYAVDLIDTFPVENNN